MGEMVERVAKAIAEVGVPGEADMEDYARAAIEAMRDIPNVCYEHYRCDKPWRELNSTEVLNLWLDAALK